MTCGGCVTVKCSQFMQEMQYPEPSQVCCCTFSHNARFRAVHEEVVKLDHDFGSSFSGVLTDGAGSVRAMWASYAEQVDKDEREWCAGLPTHVFLPWVQRLINMEAANALVPPTVR